MQLHQLAGLLGGRGRAARSCRNTAGRSRSRFIDVQVREAAGVVRLETLSGGLRSSSCSGSPLITFFLRRPITAKRNMTDFIKSRQLADEAMRRGDFLSANDHYVAAWDDYSAKRRAASDGGNARKFDEKNPSAEAFWLLLSGANAQFCAKDFEGCLDTCVTAFNLFKDLGYVVGNPLFHLRLGQASFELDPPGERDPADLTIDNLARALICGGIEIYRHEDKKYLEPVVQVLRPPKGFSSWHEAAGEGCSIEKLNGASGFLVDLLAAKYGKRPPYPGP